MGGGGVFMRGGFVAGSFAGFGQSASTSFVFVALLNKQQIVDCDRANNYGRPELFVSDFSTCMARFGC